MRTLFLVLVFSANVFAIQAPKKSFFHEISATPIPVQMRELNSPGRDIGDSALDKYIGSAFRNLHESRFLINNFETASAEEIKQAGIESSCDGKWMKKINGPNRVTFVCAKNNFANGPLIGLANGRRISEATYSKGIEQQMTLYSPENPGVVLLKRNLVEIKDGYALMNIVSTQCALAGDSEIKFRRDNDGRIHVDLKQGKKPSESFLLDDVLNVTDEDAKSNPPKLIAVVATALRMYGAFSKPASNPDLTTGWEEPVDDSRCENGRKLRRRTGSQLRFRVVEESCFLGKVYDGPSVTKVFDGANNLVSTIESQYEQNISMKKVTTEPGGQRPLQEIETFHRNYKGFVLQNVKLNECSQPHYVRLTFEKDKDLGNYFLKREVEKNGETTSAMPLSFSTLKRVMNEIYNPAPTDRPTSTVK